MQVLLREIILQPNCTVIMEMRGSCLETQTQNDDEPLMCVWLQAMLTMSDKFGFQSCKATSDPH